MSETQHKTSTRGASIVQRPRINKLLEKAFESSLVSVVGGPGCGKTLAVYEYLINSDIKTVWVQFTKADRAPSVFWETLCNAVSHINVELAKTLAQIGFPASESRFGRIRDIVADAKKPRLRYAVVFDDLHLLGDGETLSMLKTIAGRGGNGLSFVLISREEIFLPYDARPIESDFVLIDQKELMFTKGEVEDYFAALHIPAAATLIEGVFEATEGHAHLVNLAGKLLIKQSSSQSYIKTALKSNIMRLIDEQFYSELSDETKKFLVRLSLLDHLPKELVDKIGGEVSMAETMKRTSFIRCDAYMGAYHIHHMLLEFLRGKLEILDAAEEEAVYEAAAKWCVENGFLLEAIGYYQKKKDFKAILDIVFAMQLEIDFHSGAYLIKIFEDAPEKFYKENPGARVLHTRILMSLGRFSEAKEMLSHYIAETEKEKKTSETSQVLLWLNNNMGFTEILLCPETGDYSFSKYFEKAAEYIDPTVETETVDVSICPYACLVGTNKKGEPERFAEAIEKAMPFAVESMNGCLYGADDLTWAELAYFRGDLQEAENRALAACFKGKEKGQSEIENRALFFLLRIYLYQGKYSRISEVLSQLDDVPKRAKSPSRFVQHEIVRSWYFASIEEPMEIAGWLKSDFLSGAPEAYVTGLEDITKCRYYMFQKNEHMLLSFLERKPSLYGLRRYLLGQIELLAYEAAARYHIKDKKRAFVVLKKACELAAPNGFILQFVELGNAMRALAGAALKEKDLGIPKEWLETLRSRSSTYAKRVANVRSQYRFEHGGADDVALTVKEKQILFDLSQGLSRAEIALGRGISINTVKVALPIIFEKLGAEGSMDAVRIALAKHLLDK